MSFYIVSTDEKVCPKLRKKALKGKNIYLFLPPNLNLNELNRVLTGEAGTSKIQRDALLFYTYIFKGVLHAEERDTSNWVPVPRDARRTIFGPGYDKIIKLLLKANLLELKQHNEDGEFFEEGYTWFGGLHGGVCKRYRIPSHLLTGEKMYTILKEKTTQVLVNKVTALNKPSHQIEEKYRALVADNLLDIVLLDSPECRAAVDVLLASRNTKMTSAEYIELFERYGFELPVVCKYGGRLHHEVVRMKKNIKPHQRFRDHLDQPVVEADFVACQPTILANLSAKLIKAFAPECGDVIPLLAKYQSKADFQEYQAHCFAGTIYEHLRDQFNMSYADKLASPIIRDDAKNIFFVAAFSNYAHREAADTEESMDRTYKRLVHYTLVGDQQKAEAAEETLFKKRSYAEFKRLFPSVHAFFYEVKKLSWSFNPGEQHSNNCLLAQRIESGIVMTRLVKALYEAGIKKVTTTHDAINVMEKDEKLARKIIQREVKKLGLKMQLKDNTPTVVEEVMDEAPVAQLTEADLFEQELAQLTEVDMFEAADVLAYKPRKAVPADQLTDEEFFSEY